MAAPSKSVCAAAPRRATPPSSSTASRSTGTTATAGSPTLALFTLPGLSAIRGGCAARRAASTAPMRWAGRIDFLSARPTARTQADGEVEIGSWDTRRIQGWVSGPIGRAGSADGADAPPSLGFAAGVDGIDSHGYAAQTTNSTPMATPTAPARTACASSAAPTPASRRTRWTASASTPVASIPTSTRPTAAIRRPTRAISTASSSGTSAPGPQ